MDAQRNELTIDDVMADPVIGSMMKADRVDPRALRDLLDRARDAQGLRARCVGVPFARLRASRPWAGMTPPPTSGRGCGASRAW